MHTFTDSDRGAIKEILSEVRDSVREVWLKEQLAARQHPAGQKPIGALRIELEAMARAGEIKLVDTPTGALWRSVQA